jgi:protein-L-isoaspartate(D-aspartate) O-methyltransferase
MDLLRYKKEIMLNHHLVQRGIDDPRVLAAMREVPREEFVPPEFREHAYDDNPLPIEEGQTISQPYIVAYMAEALQVGESEKVLEIGTGSGYAAAVVSRMVKEVFTIERFPSLAAAATDRLERLGYHNVHVLCGDGSVGWPEKGPYNGIVVTAGAPRAPKPLMEQLSPGGNLVIPVGTTHLFQSLVRIHRVHETEYREEYLLDVRFVPLTGRYGWGGPDHS